MERAEDKVDVIIIGAGAAGLACASYLTRHNKTFLILEGRDRVGGRIFTHHDPHFQTPIELGAEFIHGVAHETLARLSSEGLSFYDALDTHYLAENGKLKERNEFWEEVGKIMEKLDEKKDRTFARFLEEEHPGNEEQRKFALAYVEGFHGADTKIVGEKGLKSAEQTDEEDLNGATQFRLISGYDKLIASFVHTLHDPNQSIRLATIAKKVTWKKDFADVECVTGNGGARKVFSAKKVVLTLPMGVLAADSGEKAAVQFEPEVPQLKESVQGVRMGHSLRVILRFRERSWESLSKEPIGFLHTGPEHDFPTWWTTQPLRTPLLVAWQGGPKAKTIAARGKDAVVDSAMKTLSYMTGIKLPKLYDQLAASYFHDWDQDPFSLGSYSFVAAGGWRGAELLTQPIDDTLYFAGEATDLGPARGTVNGAIASGERVARLILNVQD